MRCVLAIYLCVALLASPAAAQNNQTQRLFECSLNDGANKVGVHVGDDEITYRYANADGLIDLTLNDTVATVEHTLALWDDVNFTESVTFYNGATSYEVFSEAGRNRPVGDKHVLDGGAVDGGILVTQPDGTHTEIVCDPNTIEPQNPLHRLARLAALKNANYDMYADCSASGIIASACSQIVLQNCYDATDPTNNELECLTDHYDRTQALLSNTYASALAFANERGEDTVALERAQDAWSTSRNADCTIAAWTIYNPFDSEKGALICLADYTAKRIDFLTRYTIGLEFDG
ncbi:lysozyme inhibitor LprI family protein [Parasulfitobacter algicola]|uniref:DUF1311 domain-containing protein n=1 Tax=Parasulfitobacter algicola TaxID=2614809 RepID=A0ABX2IKC5_9RHOB|nr:lysozyme inhibitor LprI family protein [Sulfitobacter algicola]NSX53322.1 DUF1311 domain-containing protein [Sulfitobacter algicola]